MSINPEAIQKELEEQTQFILEVAKKKGADEAAVVTSWGYSSKINFEKNDFNLAASHDGSGFGISVHKDQRSGSATINRFSKETVEETIDRALTLAKYSIPDEYLCFAQPGQSSPLVGVWDDQLVDFPMSELRALAVSMIDEAKSDPRISLDVASMDLGVGLRVVANSNGVFEREGSTSLSWSLMGMAIDGEDITSFDYKSDFSYLKEDAAAKSRATASRLRDKLIGCLNPIQPVSYKGQALLCPALVDELLIDPVIWHTLGGNIMDGKSRLAEALNQKVANEAITLLDRPHDARFKGCTSFNGEGLPTQEMTLIQEGLLKHHLDSCYSANKRGTQPTANGGGPHVAILEGGKRSSEELIQSSEGHLLQCERYSGNLDPITGDFSGVAKGAHLYENGSYLGPVRETMIAGNVFELVQGALELSSNREDEGGSFLMPWAMVEGMSVSAP